MPVQVRPLGFWADPFAVFVSLKGKRPGALLESARVSARSGRWSFAAAGPRLELRAKGRRIERREKGKTRLWSGDPFAALQAELKKFRPPAAAALPFAGGAVGLVGYEAKNLLEPRLPQAAVDDLGLPDLSFLFFDEGFAFDHVKREVFAFAPSPARLEALSRLAKRAKSPAAKAPSASGPIESSFAREGFLGAVRRAKAHIRAGDVFQVNLSQRLGFGLKGDGLDVYARLRALNPSGFFGYFDAGDFRVVCGSPERLLRVESGIVETRPIAGTRPRGKNAAEDAALSAELLLSEKERAEHVMLVDLERNDLGRVCEYGSVSVDELMALEEYSHVKHIVSNVSGTLRPGLHAIDALKAVFPGGTITGAPKVRCMEIIDGLEPVARGPYTGSLGYAGWTGGLDFNIIIRSLVLKNGRAYLQVGAGVVADSIPEREYDETLHKAEAVLTAVFGRAKTRAFLGRCGVASR